MTDYNYFLSKLKNNLNILREREAKYAGSAPLDLLNQIEDHQQAITLTDQAIAGQITKTELEEALKPLNLAEPGPTFRERVDRFLFGRDDDRYQRTRQIMLTRVDDFWIKGVLENSLHGAALIALGMEERQEAVEHPWDMVLHVPEQPNRMLPKNTKMIEVFDQMRESLLILGEPGSGKTTMLLELARDLIARAEQDPEYPIPVVFNLSSWAQKRETIAEWLVEELNTKYNIPKKITKPWIENEKLLLLLDGLDEVALDHRDHCVTAINNFRKESLIPVVVCSRIADYEVLTNRLNLSGAVLLQRLTSDQIDMYLDEAGAEFSAVRQILEEDKIFREMVKSPLMLSITTLAYQGLSSEQLQTLSTVEARREHLFDTYIKNALERRKTSQFYQNEQTVRWLRWLAQGMKQEAQTVFLIERLQPSWLPTRFWRWTYIVASRLSAVLIGVLIFGLSMGLAIGLLFGLLIVLSDGLIDVRLSEGLSFGLIMGLVLGLFFMPFAVSVVGLSGSHPSLTNDIQTVKALQWSWRKASGGWLLGALFFGLICGLSSELLAGLVFGPFFGLIFGLIEGLRGRRGGLTNDIQPVENLRWSWRKAFVGGLIGVLFFGLIFGLITGNFELFEVLIFGLIGGPIGAILFGLRRELIGTKTLRHKGLLLSARNATLGGLSVGLIFGLIIGLIVGLISLPPLISIVELRGFEMRFGLILLLIVALIFGLFFMPFAGVIVAFRYGNLDIIKHYTLRLILILNGYIPRNYAQFLDYAAECILLRKVGGGYIFIHRLLLEHFAAMEREQ